MKFNFRKIASVLSSAVMVSSTVALAAAATSYPAPFIKGGQADVAVVFGSAPGAQLDLAAVVDVTNDLQYQLARQTAVSSTVGTSVSTTGETAALFEGSSKIYANDSLNSVRSSLTKSYLPTVLADGSFSGNVDATYTQRLDLGTNPALSFSRQPSSSDDPQFAISLGTAAATAYIYNATITFNKVVAFNHSDSEGQDITLFGQKFTVASATDGTDLVLLKTAQRISVTSDNPTAEVTIKDKKYTIELISASDTAATIKVTDEAGASETKEISENASKKVQGLTIAITNADETNLKLSASVIAGAERVKLTDGNNVRVGEDDKNIDGTNVEFPGNNPGNISEIRISVAAKGSDFDALKEGGVFTDPVFGSFKLDFSAGLNIPVNSTAREEIKFSHNSDDKSQIKFTDHRGKEATQIWARANSTAGSFAGLGLNDSNAALQGDNDGHNISVFERAQTFKNEYLVVGNENSGHLVKVTTLSNTSSTGTAGTGDSVKFTDVFDTSLVSETSITSEGTGSVVLGGKSYSVIYSGDSGSADDSRYVRLQYPDSSAATAAILWPTIQTSKGAKVMFYKPVNVTLDDWDNAGNDLATIRIPNGNGYSDLTIASSTSNGTQHNWVFTAGGTSMTINLNASAGSPGPGTSGHNGTVLFVGGANNDNRLRLNITSAGQGALASNYTLIRLENPQGAAINNPAIVIFEEKDDNSEYHFNIVTLEPGASGDDGLGIADIVRSWSPTANDTGGTNGGWADTLSSNSKITKKADLYGSIITYDDSDSDQRIATLSYPDEQIWAQLYVAKNDAEISGGSSSGGGGTVTALGSVSVKDSEVASVSGKNLVVIGGSCVNTVAASLLGESFPLCGSDWESKTSVGSGSFLIQTFDRSGGKVATLVAGYNAGDTAAGVKTLTTDAIIDLTAGKKFKGTGTEVAMVDVAAASETTTA